MGWVCKNCSSNNEDSDEKCIVCDELKEASIAAMRAAAAAPSPSPTSTASSDGGVCTLTAGRAYALSLRGDVVIPSEFNVIGEDAFLNRTDITSVRLHAGVKKIMKGAFSGCKKLARVETAGRLDYIGARAFYNCEKLTPENRPKAKRVASDAFLMPGATPAPTRPAEPTPPPAPAPRVTATPTPIPRVTSTPTPIPRITATPITPVSPVATPVYTDYTTSSRLGVSTRVIVIVSILLAVIFAPFMIMLGLRFEPEAWEWITGSVGGAVICGALAFTAWYNYDENDIEMYMTSTVSFAILSALNTLLMIFVGVEYLAISSILNIVFAIGTWITALVSFEELEDGWAWVNIGFMIANVIVHILFILIT